MMSYPQMSSSMRPPAPTSSASMYSAYSSPNGLQLPMVSDIPGYQQENDQDESVHSDDEYGANGEGQSPPDRGGSEEQNGSNSFSNFSLKRCRFSPRHDIALLKDILAADDKPFEHVGKASWESWGKIAATLNQKQIFGPVLTLSALTCKLRFDFLMKNYGGHAMKFNPKRGTVEEYQKRDELIAIIIPQVPTNDDLNMPNGKRRRGRPRKERRENYSPEEEDPSSPPEYGSQSMLDSGSKRKPGRPRKIPLGQGDFMDGAALSDYLRPRTSQPTSPTKPVSNGLPPGTSTLAFNPLQHLAYGETTIVSMLVEYMKRHHESDVQFRREELESRQREKSEERRLERERLDVKRAELALQQEKWELEKRERELQMDILRRHLSK
ncbi:hypothetical protein RvY_15636 [Ramazzottius varieornatus]|uniref:Myb-like domain-containing protein n=1 Tax=Ramazzottius varieornatus TaxID=947166 RepID=A0A1D1VVL6_RAMVA|nr:hypothetical protein RvY_15636 [Ramazzottius varieornatus]